MRAEELLVLNYDNFSERAGLLFEQISQSPAFRELFMRNPAGVLNSIMFPGQAEVSIGRINQANRLLFSALTNTKFMQWATAYQETISAEIGELANKLGEREASKQWIATLDKPKIYQDLVQAIQDTADQEMCIRCFLQTPIVSSRDA